MLKQIQKEYKERGEKRKSGRRNLKSGSMSTTGISFKKIIQAVVVTTMLNLITTRTIMKVVVTIIL